MKSAPNFIALFLAFFVFFACNEAPKTPQADKVGAKADTELAAIIGVVHNFYKWYETNGGALADINFVKGGKSTTIIEAKLDEYFAFLEKSGCISKAFSDSERAYFKNLEATDWKNANADEEPITGLDYDRFLCSQDVEDFKLLTAAPVSAQGLGTEKAEAVLLLPDGYQSKKLELVKENGKWLISKFICE